MFTIPEPGEHEPLEIFTRLVEADPLFDHLRSWEPKVAFLLRDYPVSQNQRQVIGSCSMPTVQGRHRILFAWMLERLLGYEPVFLFTLDSDWWANATPREREILMFHEMLHTGIAKDAFGVNRYRRDTGEPIWAIIGHDVEEFTEVVSKYGAWDESLVRFRDALNSHSEAASE